MPQEFHVLRCFECGTFQVHIVKKSKKWDCKMCGAKQSLKKVYFSGPAKDCRLHVQSLNEQRVVTDSYQNYNKVNNDDENENNCENNIKLVDPEQSKWKEFIHESDNSETELENCGMTFERQKKRRKYNKTEDNSNKKVNKNSFANQDHENISDYNNENFNNQEKIGKQSKWNSFVPENEDNNEELQEINEEHENNSGKSGKFMESIKNKNAILKWNSFVTQENEELQETLIKPVNSKLLKQSKWDCFITKKHEDNKEEEEENNFECEVKSNQLKQSLKNKSLFSQIQPADEDSLDFLNLD